MLLTWQEEDKLLGKVAEFNKLTGDDCFFLDGEAPNQAVAIRFGMRTYVWDGQNHFNLKNSRMSSKFDLPQIIEMKQAFLGQDVERPR